MINPTQVLLLDEAVDDLNIGKEFYDQREDWLGDYFWDSILSDIESLYLYAGIHPRYFSFYRKLSNRFPYSIYYDIKENNVIVVAVLPMKKDPNWIKQILSNRI